MPGYALLLRGINVGGRNVVAMADLRALLSGLGLDDVRTHLNSGNAVFTSPSAEPAALARRIEAAMAAELGKAVPCLILTAAEIRTVVEQNPLTKVATNGSRMMAHLLFEPLDQALLAEHDPVALSPTEIAIGDRVIYQWCPDGLLNAPGVGAFAEKLLKAKVTTRNWNTVTKLDTLLNG